MDQGISFSVDEFPLGIKHGKPPVPRQRAAAQHGHFRHRNRLERLHRVDIDAAEVRQRRTPLLRNRPHAANLPESAGGDQALIDFQNFIGGRHRGQINFPPPPVLRGRDGLGVFVG